MAASLPGKCAACLALYVVLPRTGWQSMSCSGSDRCLDKGQLIASDAVGLILTLDACVINELKFAVQGRVQRSAVSAHMYG